MHEAAFRAKRLHLCWVRHGRKILRAQVRKVVDSEKEREELALLEHMTPARYDVMYMLARVRMQPGKDTPKWGQRDIRTWLDLHASTVSKMLKRLARRCADDLRRNVWELTELGRKAIEAAMRVIEGQRSHANPIETHFVEVHGRGDRAYDPLPRIGRFVEEVGQLARKLWDDSRLRYPLRVGSGPLETRTRLDPLRATSHAASIRLDAGA
jgi:DNA-binding MarR family transcriptional regulator